MSGTEVPAAVPLPGVVVLSGWALRDVRWALEIAERATRRDGIGSPPRWQQLRRAFEQAVADAPTAVNGSADVPQPSAQALSEHDLIDTREAAAMLGCGVRNVRDLAHRGVLASGHRFGGRLLLQRAEVEALALYRQAVREAEEFG